jgi:hypothetical protein
LALGGASAVPDLRGQFLRGLGGQSAVIGVKQTDATYVREGEATTTLSRVKASPIASSGGARPVDEQGMWDEYYSALTTGIMRVGNNGWYTVHHSSDSKVDLNFKISTPGVEETRPTNTAVRYIIRALP